MGIVAQLALGVLAISFMTFVAFFGRLPALRHTPIAWIYRVMWVSIPNALHALDQRLTSGRVMAFLGRFGHRLWYGRHPTVLIFFVLLLSVGEYMYLPGAWPRLSPLHKTMGGIAIILPYLFLYLAAYTDPGVITPNTHTRYMSLYPYDFTLFHPGQSCRTCHLLKPARSKHCAVCNRCVAKLDHHCVFINNCVGYGNQHWFMLLLLSTAILTSYGAYLGFGLIASAARVRAPSFSLWKPRGQSWGAYAILLTIGIQDDVGVGSVTLLAAMTSPLVWGLLAYHLYLVYCGTTTNESMKWQDWAAEMHDGFAFRRALSPSRPRDPRVEPAWTRWPVDAAHLLVRTESGEPPREREFADMGAVGPWEHVWNLRDVENLYDLGFWDNLVDVFGSHQSFRGEAVTDLERGKKCKKPKASRGSAVVAAAT
ncbi:zf-DHHC-domain-containing protein [Xylariomycetidae sp. FL0641]|nr:zf-DHHC-domain-containing protein [Xylariomycetidae sp. FL0641]